MKIYSIKDKAMGYQQIFTAPNDYAGLRMFADTLNGGQNMLNMHPEDFQLYRLGELVEDTGEITPEIKFLEEASNLIKK